MHMTGTNNNDTELLQLDNSPRLYAIACCPSSSVSGLAVMFEPLTVCDEISAGLDTELMGANSVLG